MEPRDTIFGVKLNRRRRGRRVGHKRRAARSDGRWAPTPQVAMILILAVVQAFVMLVVWFLANGI